MAIGERKAEEVSFNVSLEGVAVSLFSKVRRYLLPCMIAGVFLESGCGKEPTRPDVTSVTLAVTAAPEVGDPSAPVSVRIVAKNAGTTRVLHCSGCGCENGIGVTVLGPDGIEVALHDPNAVGPACPDGVAPLGPGETVEGSTSFTGLLYRRGAPTIPSPTYPAPSGTYTVIAAFGYKSSPSGEWILQERRITFAWNS